ncbi:MAG: universal stress protein [Halodesulfurarchaeum sp.]
MCDRVILAIDSSDESRRAARTGIELAGILDVPIEVVHVLERSLLDALRSSGDRDQIRGERRELLAEVESMAKDRGIESTSKLLEGRPADRIESVATERSDPVIVLGRQGRSSISRRVLGGVTERVLGSAVAPVLVEPGDGPDEPTLPPSAILVPTDGSENAERAFEQVAELAGETGARVHVLSVLDLQQSGGVFDAGGLDPEFVNRQEEVSRNAVESGRERLLALDPSIEVSTDLERSSDFDGVSGVIASYADSRDIDLIVMGSHGRSNVKRQVLGSVTATVIRSVNVPVLVVPREV